MKYFSARTMIACAATLSLATFSSVAATAQRLLADLSGTWAFAVVTENGTGTPTVILKQEGEKLTGTYESARMGVRNLEGTVKNDSLRFVLKGEVALTFAGVVVDKDHLRGVLDMGGQGGANFTAVRQ